MAAQGSERKFNICDRCFASVPASQPFCPECGAPIVNEEHHTEGSDAAVYTELARANLLRMRGDYRQAEEQCLNILKRFPNNASANTLLGDISAEQGDLPQAVQWYELSLDLIPDDDGVKGKLRAVKERISVHETAATAKELGLPASASKKNAYIAGVIALVFAVAIAGYVFGSKETVAQSEKQTRVTAPVPVPPQPGPNQGTDLDQNLNPGGGELPLMRRLVAATADGAKVLAVFQDPRSKAVVVSYMSDPDPRPQGARLARSVFDVEPDALNVTVRAMREGNLIYTADVLRARINDTITQAWKAQNADPNAWVEYVLTNEWSAGPLKSDSGSKASDDSGRAADSASKESDASAKAPAKATDESDTSDKTASKADSGN